MAKISPVDPAAATGRVKEIFDGPLKGKHLNIFKSMGASPAVLDFYLGMAGALGSASLSAAEQEAIHLAVSEKNGCDYCLAAHAGLGKAAGLSPDDINAARRGGGLSDAKLNALVGFAVALKTTDGRPGEGELQAMRDAGYGDGAIAEAIAVYAMAVFTNYFNHVNETETDLPAAPALA